MNFKVAIHLLMKTVIFITFMNICDCNFLTKEQRNNCTRRRSMVKKSRLIAKNSEIKVRNFAIVKSYDLEINASHSLGSLCVQGFLY